ncbi:MAG: hypothetical protein IT258_00805 [Saprospiraceae bacterium]|nr:hypothetical protein [Saprospiraceae bacterium]
MTQRKKTISMVGKCSTPLMVAFMTEKNNTAQNMWTTAGEITLDGREAAIKLSFQAQRTTAEPPRKVSALAGLAAKTLAGQLRKNYF